MLGNPHVQISKRGARHNSLPRLYRGSKFKPCLVWVRVPPGVPNVCPRDGTDIRAGLRNQILWVRLHAANYAPLSNFRLGI
ncbi:MAG: hypothetical protein AAGF83_22855 [Cyanobacteria bacterium P01_G01_bin.67]